jgi:arylsulfatase A-like enzyme
MKRVVTVILDGLRADHAFGLDLPNIARLRAAGVGFSAHLGIFPSATRASSASVATGVFPRRHGVHGNQMALREAGGLVSHDVGRPEFFERLRAVSGHTLRVPTLAERVSGAGGSIVFSNVSPGAALAQDPDGHGHVYNRAVSQAPGRVPAANPLSVELSAAGDAAMVDRFIEEALLGARPASAVLWLSNPDDAQHNHPLGSPAAVAAIREADRQLGRVIDAMDRLDPGGDKILLMAGSDHGHETVQAYIPVEAEIIAAGFKADPEDGSLVLAPQGSGLLIYAADGEQARMGELAEWLEARDWCGRVVRASELASIGQAADGGLALAVSMRSTDDANPFGTPGSTFVATRFETEGRTLRNGSHGGMGPYETNPFLVARGAGFPAGVMHDAATCLVDLAPTALAHLGLDATGMDGKPLQERFVARG